MTPDYCRQIAYTRALGALHIGGHHGDLLGIGGAVITCYTRWDLVLIPLWHWHVPLLALAVALGCAAHIAGDELTHGGCPILWPVSGYEFHLVPRPLQITTAKMGENWVVFPLLVLALFLAVWHATGHPLLSHPRLTWALSLPPGSGPVGKRRQST